MFPALDAGPSSQVTDAAGVDRFQVDASAAETSIGDASSDGPARDADTRADAPASEDGRTREDARRN
jgi:hypothetical protein